MRFTTALTFLFFLFALTLTVKPQPGPDDYTRLVRLKLERLAKPISVHYSSSGKDRAKLAAKFIHEASRFHSRRAGLTTQLTIAVLDSSDWRTMNGERPPFGALFTSAKPHVIFIPANDESEIAKLWRQMESVLPSKQRELLSERETAYIGIHEFGHTVIEESRINVGNKWFSEFLATYYAYSFLKEKYPKDAAAWRAAANAYALGHTPQYKRLDDFERLYNRVGLANYGWYQSKFLLLAAEVYDAEQYSFLTSVNGGLPKLLAGQDWLEELLTNPVPIPDLLARLDKIHPGFTTWAEQMKEPQLALQTR